MIQPTQANKSPFYFFDLDGIEYQENEVFVHVIYNGNIISQYYISNHGRLYTMKYKRCITPYYRRGYYRVRFNYNGSRIDVGVHRLMLMSFQPIVELDRFVANHIDGIKSNNQIENLEWVTQSTNCRHAIDTGLSPILTNRSSSSLDQNTIEIICQMISDRYNNVEIINKLCDLHIIDDDQNQRDKIYNIVANIRYGSRYQSISMNYNIPGMQGNYRFPEELAYKVRDIMSRPESANYNYDDLADILNIPKERRRYFRVFVINAINDNDGGYIDAKRKIPNAKKPLQMKKTDKNYYLYY